MRSFNHKDIERYMKEHDCTWNTAVRSLANQLSIEDKVVPPKEDEIDQ